MSSSDQMETVGSGGRRGRRRRAVAVAGLALAGLAAVAGCQSAPAATGPAPSVTPAQAAASSPATIPSTPVPTAPVSSAAPSAPATPVLGQLAGIFAHGTGFGQVRPAEVFNGGDPTGLVSKISWSSWGGATATGAGTSTYVAANQAVAAGTPQPATIVAFDLGTCHGKLMYQAVEWYFPQHGQAFSASHYENVCTGTFVPSA
ncbi:MAG TPA: hypothetical protein VGM79_16470 [Streptosporangiaceae bacterium]|jgi:hypothetical protein